jgi:hypothetical protein
MFARVCACVRACYRSLAPWLVAPALSGALVNVARAVSRIQFSGPFFCSYYSITLFIFRVQSVTFTQLSCLQMLILTNVFACAVHMFITGLYLYTEFHIAAVVLGWP